VILTLTRTLFQGWFSDGDDRGAANDKKEIGGSAENAASFLKSFKKGVSSPQKSSKVTKPFITAATPRQRGTVATCRCWKEMGYGLGAGNMYTCTGRCKGAGWAKSGSNVCGGRYKFTSKEATTGLKALWDLKEDPKSDLRPKKSTFVAQVEVVTWKPWTGNAKDPKQWSETKNYFDGPLNFECGNDPDKYGGMALTAMRGEKVNEKRWDRQWR
jgi:hypothetical protein